jgi:hypothetical protein
MVHAFRAEIRGALLARPEFRELAAVARQYRREIPGPGHSGFLTAIRAT